jgi:DNA-binding GntR family transcriptional regulator
MGRRSTTTVDGTAVARTEPQERTTMTQAAVAALRDLIVLGEIPPGAPLRLEELSNRLKMSFSPIREAIRQLEMTGFVTHAPYKGATVTRLSFEEMEAIYETRLAIESVVVRRAATHFDEENEARLQRILAELDQAYRTRDRLRVVRGNTAFHVALASASGSTWLERLVQQVEDAWERYSAAVILIERPEETFVEEARGHRAILEACQAGDANAAEGALREHLATWRDIFMRISVPGLLLKLDDGASFMARHRASSAR